MRTSSAQKPERMMVVGSIVVLVVISVLPRPHDEAMIARDLQAAGMARSDALRAAARHVARTNRHGMEMGRIVNVGRVRGDNGGPLLDELLP